MAELNVGEVRTLQELALQNTGRGSASAKNILNFFYGFRMWSYPILPAGVYFYRVETNRGHREVKKLVIYK